ncbi:MAG TPA: iron-sulfur cluster assembly accessory protein [Acidobacteriota bacterium]|nr:iron-sulfur cluster assembly accessory protein [Acidobacteriota bacterium]
MFDRLCIMGTPQQDSSPQLQIEFTDLAREKVQEALSRNPGKTAVRIEARENGTPQFAYAMRLIGDEGRREDDRCLDIQGLSVVVDPESAENLRGATIDFEDRIVRSGFKFNNPNKPKVSEKGSGLRGELTGSIAERVQRLLEEEINPAVAAHGGVIQLLGVEEGKVYLQFGGGCHGCGMVNYTLKQGVEARIREAIPEVEEVVDVTDHSTGANPYY